MDNDLGKITTVINNRPYTFHVSSKKYDAGTADPLDNFPYIFIFNDLNILKDSDSINFTLKPVSDLIYSVFRGINNDLFREAIRYGIYRIKAFPASKNIELYSSDYDDFRKIERITGTSLRTIILQLIYFINNYLPTTAVNIEDLQFNLNAFESEIQQWADSLTEEEYLIRSSEKIQNRFGGGMKSIFTYKINPKKRKIIAEELDRAELDVDQLNIFFSYNTTNKIQAGIIKKGLETEKIKVFLAHESIDVTKPWEDEILKNLKSCQVFLALVITPDFRASHWTDQESGFALVSALENKKYIISLFNEKSPHGFLNRYQGIYIGEKNEDQICREIIAALQKIPRFEKYFT